MSQTRIISHSVPTSIGSSEFLCLVLFKDIFNFHQTLRPNVPLSATTQRRIRLDGHTPYIPPHPQQGTTYHRYVLLLLPQPPLDNMTYTLNTEARAETGVPTSQTLDIPPVEPAERANFDVRAFVQQWGLDIVPGGGAHMWREVWNSRVSKIYRNVLSKSLLPSDYLRNVNVAFRGARTTVRQVTKGGSLCGVQAKETLYLARLYFIISAVIEVHKPCSSLCKSYEVYRSHEPWVSQSTFWTIAWILVWSGFPNTFPWLAYLHERDSDQGTPEPLTSI